MMFMGMEMTEQYQSLSFEKPTSTRIRSPTLTFTLNPQMTTTITNPPDMLHLISDFGGLMYLLASVFGMMTYKFGQMYVKALMSNHLFYFNSDFNV
jgi:hypothetical protein